MKKVLTVCAANVCRSPMAEGILRHLMEKRGLPDIQVASMGLSVLEEGGGASVYAVEALDEIGIDISGHRSRKAISEELLEADRVYVMTDQHKDVILDALPELEPRVRVLEIPDPFHQGMEAYRSCRDAMLDYFERELDSFLEGDES